MDDKQRERLEQVATSWRSIMENYSTEGHASPINSEEEKQKVFSAEDKKKEYNPQFKYRLPSDLPDRQLSDFIISLKPNETVWDKLYFDIALHRLQQIEMIRSRQPSFIVTVSASVHGYPTRRLLDEAKKILDKPVSAEVKEEAEKRTEGDFTPYQVVAKCQSALQIAGLKDWRAVIRPNLQAGTTTNARTKELRINADRTYSPEQLRSVIASTIALYISRVENGSKQPAFIAPIFGEEGTLNNIATSYGLSVRYDDLAGRNTAERLRTFSLHLIAIFHSLHSPFFTVYKLLRDQYNVTQKKAFEIATRAKGYMQDTAEPGARTTNISYLSGYLDVTAFLSQNAEDEKYLFAGRVGIDTVPLLKKLEEQSLLVLPEQTPKIILEKLQDFVIAEVDQTQKKTD